MKMFIHRLRHGLRVTASVLRAGLCVLCGGLCVLALSSCAPKTSAEALSLYARAGEVYAQGRFAETAEMLGGTGKFPPGLLLRAKAEYFSGELDRAEKSCRRLISLRPSAFEARLYLARILRDKGDFDGAEVLAEALLTDYSQDVRALRLASGLAREKGRTDRALALLDQAAELSAECALALLDRARLHWIAGRGNEALEDLSRARAMLPWDTPLLRSVEHLESLIKEALQ